ncbi:MAG TPA: DsbA family protein [Acidimicrobiales bacterium]|nr:DsbA family protein [Acidimicrobiales bacterium]
MSTSSFAVTYDYRCPFARNVHEHLVVAVRGGAEWTVEYLPFSLTQSHIEEGGTPVWDSADKGSDLTAVEAGLVVRDRFPERFLDVHLALFTARHDEGRDLRDEAVVGQVLKENGVDADEVFAVIADGWPRRAFRQAHEAAVADHKVFGVPTFISGNASAFVRIMTRPRGDADMARSTIEHVLDLLVGHPEMNEFKHTSISR